MPLHDASALCPRLQSLDQVVDLFESLGEKTRAAKVLPVLRRLHERAHASVEDHQRQMRETVNGTKRESSQDLLLVQGEDDIDKLVGSTRLVLRKPISPSSLRDSRFPVSSPQNPLHAQNSPPPVTPGSTTVSPLYEEQEQIHGYPMAASPSYYVQSPEMALYGDTHMVPQTLPNSHVYSQVLQQQQHQQIQNHWQPNPALHTDYRAIPMQTDNNQGSMVGQYGLGSGYDYMTSACYDQEVYTHTPQEHISPQNVDTEGAWQSLYMEFGGAS